MLEQLPILQTAAPQSVVDRMSPHDILPIVIVAIALSAGTLIALTSIIVGNWKRVRERQVAASLIQDMLDRNMSAPEVQQLVDAWASASGGRVDVPQHRRHSETPNMPPKPAAS